MSVARIAKAKITTGIKAARPFHPPQRAGLIQGDDRGVARSE
jgi:hypothetical protein